MSALPAAAWFPDPADPSSLRWWDGTQWTTHVAPAQPHVAPEPAPVPAPAPVFQHPAAPALFAPVLANPHVAVPGAPPTLIAPAPSYSPATFAAIPPRGGSAGTRIGIGVIATVIVAVLVVVVAGVGVKGSLSPTQTLDYAFTTPDGGMSVALPKKPDVQTKTSDLGEGMSLDFEIFTAALDQGRGGVAVTSVDYNALFEGLDADERDLARDLMEPRAILDGAAKGAAQESGGKISSSTPTKVDGHEAINVRITDGRESVTEGQFVFDEAKLTMYMVVLVTHDGDAKLFSRLASSIKMS